MAATQACLVAMLVLGLAVAHRRRNEDVVIDARNAVHDALASVLRPRATGFMNRSIGLASHTTHAMTSGIETVDTELAKKEAWVFYYAEWCPKAQSIFQSLSHSGTFSAFRKKAIMKCFSSIEDLVEAETKQVANPEQVTELRGSYGLIDPNEGVSEGSKTKCDFHLSRSENKVYDEMEQAWISSHDLSCSELFDNGPHTSPALVIGKKKYCQTSELLEWLVKGKGAEVLKGARPKVLKGTCARTLPALLAIVLGCVVLLVATL